jgi:hypothetical protein
MVWVQTRHLSPTNTGDLSTMSFEEHTTLDQTVSPPAEGGAGSTKGLVQPPSAGRFAPPGFVSSPMAAVQQLPNRSSPSQQSPRQQSPSQRSPSSAAEVAAQIAATMPSVGERTATEQVCYMLFNITSNLH